MHKIVAVQLIANIFQLANYFKPFFMSRRLEILPHAIMHLNGETCQNSKTIFHKIDANIHPILLFMNTFIQTVKGFIMISYEFIHRLID